METKPLPELVALGDIETRAQAIHLSFSQKRGLGPIIQVKLDSPDDHVYYLGDQGLPATSIDKAFGLCSFLADTCKIDGWTWMDKPQFQDWLATYTEEMSNALSNSLDCPFGHKFQRETNLQAPDPYLSEECLRQLRALESNLKSFYSKAESTVEALFRESNSELVDAFLRTELTGINSDLLHKRDSVRIHREMVSAGLKMIKIAKDHLPQ